LEKGDAGLPLGKVFRKLLAFNVLLELPQAGKDRFPLFRS
jgi:hypothetical protein